jgi:hypothetical protein
MKPTIGKRAASNKPQEEKPPSAARLYVEINTHQNITMKRQFMYIEDVKTAININTLEERLILKRWFLKQLESGTSNEKLIEQLSNHAEKDRHLLQKKFRISI